MNFGKMQIKHSLVPVSYTHLDVYKRQGVRRFSSDIRYGTSICASFATNTVSYTHLQHKNMLAYWNLIQHTPNQD